MALIGLQTLNALGDNIVYMYIHWPEQHEVPYELITACSTAQLQGVKPTSLIQCTCDDIQVLYCNVRSAHYQTTQIVYKRYKASNFIMFNFTNYGIKIDVK